MVVGRYLCPLTKVRLAFLFASASLLSTLRYATTPDSWDFSVSGLLVDVEDEDCSMPVLEPWDAEVRGKVGPGPSVDCGSAGEAAGLVRFHRASQTLGVDEALRRRLGGPSCAFRCFRFATDTALHWDEHWTPLNTSARLPSDCPFFRLSCTRLRLLPVLDTVFDNLQATKDALERQKKGVGRPDVVIIGLDSTSLSNARRFLPRVLDYLNETLESVVLGHHSVVGSNTKPNLLPALAGRRPWEAEGLAAADLLPLVWRNFSSAGYATAFVEDKVKYPAFSDVGAGFRRPPVDAYWRPFLLAIDGPKPWMLPQDNVCAGHTNKLHVMLDYLGRFLRFYDRGPSFSLLWSADLTHEYSQHLTLAESPLLRFLREQRERLERSFVVVMSDHGQRRDRVRESEVGRLEARLPLFALSVPREARDRLGPVLRANARRLTSQLDVFVTLADVVGGGWAESGEQEDWRGVSPHGGLSLLRRVPERRSCGSAGVPAEECVCGRGGAWAPIPLDAPAVLRAASALLGELNRRLEASAGRCAPLSLLEVRSARKLTTDRPSATLFLRLILRTLPSKAVFEGTLSVPESPQSQPSLISPIERLNTYANQSHCIALPELKSLCYCA